MALSNYAVACWGDSLTAGAGGDGVTYPQVLAERIAEKYAPVPVHNMGIGGENTVTILGRAGATVIHLYRKIVVPETCTPVRVWLSCDHVGMFRPLRQGDGGINPVELDGIPGTLSVRQTSIYQPASKVQYFFTRSEPGRAEAIPTGAALTVANEGKYDSDITVIFIGTNGGYIDARDLVSQQKLLIHSDRYLVLGLTRGSAADTAKENARMAEEFGDHFLDLRTLLCRDGLRLAGLPETDDDRSDIAAGIVPRALRVDSVHFTAAAYRVIGNAVFDRLDQLGMFDGLK